MALVLDEAGKHFDPNLVEHVTTIYDQVPRIRNKFADTE